MKRTSKNELGRFGLVAAGLALLAACGGRAMLEDGGAAGTGAISSSSAGARSTTGGTSSTHGGSGSGASAGVTASGGVSPFAGATGSGGCGRAACPALPSCDGPNEMFVVPPGQCCPVCQSTCPPCGDVACPSGYTSQLLAGQCCPTCVLDNCDAGKMAYQSMKEQYLDKYSRGCITDADCVAVSTSNQCESCDNSVVWKTVLNDWVGNLASLAQMNCSTCAPIPTPPCLPDTRTPVCLNGQCMSPPK